MAAGIDRVACMTPAIIMALAFVAWLSWEFITAPYGYQDHDGFHLGEPEE